jgi:tripartite-type tricarboxylate transporter receptor subunit TctC
MRAVLTWMMLTIAPLHAVAQDDVSSFYQGRALSLVIGGSVGGGFDSYGRLVARYMGAYIPGHPQIIPTNMVGAGGGAAASYIAHIAPKDGTVMAAVLPGTITDPLYQGLEKYKYDPRQFIYLGSANSEVDLCAVRADTGVTRLSDAMTHEVVIGASAEGGSTRDQPLVQINLIGTQFKLVSGYPGSREIFLAIEKNEVSGICGMGLPALRQQHADWLESGFLRIISQDNIKGDAELNARGISRTPDFARSDDDRRIMELIYSQQDFGRPYILPPALPPDRVNALRAAFLAALADPALVEDARKMKIDVQPVAGAHLQEIVAHIYATPASLLERARQALLAPH